ncbi:MAG: hypothetical protein ABI609_00520 [Acidobacteriota bacterium]
MAPALRLRVARAFWASEPDAQDHGHAAVLIAQKFKFRPKFVLGLDDEHRAKYLSSITAMTDSVAARALVAYHLAEQRPMMAVFLDAMGIAHENGIIEEEDAKPDAEKFAAAVGAIEGKFPAEDVSLYLTTLAWQDPEAWGALGRLAEAEG